MKHPNVLFFGSIFLGIIIWFFFFFITPIEIKTPLSFSIKSFIILSYLALIAGYVFSLVYKFKYFEYQTWNERFKSPNTKILNTLLWVVYLSFIFRYYDLFHNREVSLFNETAINKRNVSIPENFSLVFAFLGAFRALYFVPLIIYLSKNLNKKRILIWCIALFLLPFLEAYMRGARRLVFESVGLLFIILFVYKKINLKSYKTIIALGLLSTMLLGFSFSVLQGRIMKQNDEFYKEIFTSRYNELVPPKKDVIKKIVENDNEIIRKLYFSEIHVGQYITHGVFEMDLMVSEFPDYKSYGLFNFFIIAKTLNIIGITEAPVEKFRSPAKRNTYITFFGGLYLDFGWASLFLMFLFGILQKIIFSWGQRNYLFAPIVIILIFSNIFMLIFNFIRAQFLLTLIVFVIFLFFITISSKSKLLFKFQ